MKKSGRIKESLYRVFDYFYENKVFQCVRDGFVMMMPILLLGSFSVVVLHFPNAAYKEFINTFGNGIIYKFGELLNFATMGLLGLYFTIFLSFSYTNIYQKNFNFDVGPTLTSLICFGIFSGIFQEGSSLSALGSEGIFTGLVCGLGASSLYSVINRQFKKKPRLYTEGADQQFNRAVAMLVPMGVVVVVFLLIDLFLQLEFNVTGFQMLISDFVYFIFSDMGLSLKFMVLYAFVSNFSWFFGVHGDAVLMDTALNMLVPAIVKNQNLVASGAAATEIFSKTFYDAFVLIGGTGCTLSFVLALLLFSKKKSDHKLALWSTIPMCFNVNEIMLYGFPIVLNPVMFIPFVLSGIVMVLISYFAVKVGLVPIPSRYVAWITPPIISGYMTTGSIRGSLLQVFNIAVGVLLYGPFVKLYDREKERDAKLHIDRLVEILKESESSNQPVNLLDLRNREGVFAKNIVDDLKYRLHRYLPTLYYQPQFDRDKNCIGAEALLRWNHEEYGMLYPPLVIKLATEANVLAELEKAIFKSVMNDWDKIDKAFGEDGKISINVTGKTIQTDEFEKVLVAIKEKYPERCEKICVEITEQNVLIFDKKFIDRLNRIHDMGFNLAIDDFSMGSTSIKYLQINAFDLVKLDGEFSRNIVENKRSKEIVASIVSLSNNFGIEVLAEYVETDQQKKELEKAGCFLYQGYLYSPAVSADKFVEVCEKEREKVSENRVETESEKQ